MNQKRTNMIMWILGILVVILLLIVLYTFLIRPMMNGYVVKAQNQGIQYTVAVIVSQIQQQGYAQIPVGNQTLILVPYTGNQLPGNLQPVVQGK